MLHILEDGRDKITDSIRNGDARVVTDGSFKDKKGAAVQEQEQQNALQRLHGLQGKHTSKALTGANLRG